MSVNFQPWRKTLTLLRRIRPNENAASEKGTRVQIHYPARRKRQSSNQHQNKSKNLYAVGCHSCMQQDGLYAQFAHAKLLFKCLHFLMEEMVKAGRNLGNVDICNKVWFFFCCTKASASFLVTMPSVFLNFITKLTIILSLCNMELERCAQSRWKRDYYEKKKPTQYTNKKNTSMLKRIFENKFTT